MKPHLAYLLAASHSGSTLLAMLLGAQPGACSAGELKATSMGDPNLYRCSCRQLIKECPFWMRVQVAMRRRGFADFKITHARTYHLEVPSRYAARLLGPLHRGPLLEAVRDMALAISPTWRRYGRDADQRTRALVESILEITGASVLVDSSKQALRLKYLRKIPDLEVKVIRCIRDGRAVSLTYINDWEFADASDPSLRGGGSGNWRPSVRRNMEEAAWEWRRSQEANEAALTRLPRSQWTEVRYEELCADPERTLRRLMAFLDLDPDGVRLDFRAIEQHVIGNGMRFDTTSAIKLDERWKTALTEEQIATFDRIAGDLNRRLGYS